MREAGGGGGGGGGGGKEGIRVATGSVKMATLLSALKRREWEKSIKDGNMKQIWMRVSDIQTADRTNNLWPTTATRTAVVCVSDVCDVSLICPYQSVERGRGVEGEIMSNRSSLDEQSMTKDPA